MTSEFSSSGVEPTPSPIFVPKLLKESERGGLYGRLFTREYITINLPAFKDVQIQATSSRPWFGKNWRSFKIQVEEQGKTVTRTIYLNIDKKIAKIAKNSGVFDMFANNKGKEPEDLENFGVKFQAQYKENIKNKIKIELKRSIESYENIDKKINVEEIEEQITQWIFEGELNEKDLELKQLYQHIIIYNPIYNDLKICKDLFLLGEALCSDDSATNPEFYKLKIDKFTKYHGDERICISQSNSKTIVDILNNQVDNKRINGREERMGLMRKVATQYVEERGKCIQEIPQEDDLIVLMKKNWFVLDKIYEMKKDGNLSYREAADKFKKSDEFAILHFLENKHRFSERMTQDVCNFILYCLNNQIITIDDLEKLNKLQCFRYHQPILKNVIFDEDHAFNILNLFYFEIAMRELGVKSEFEEFSRIVPNTENLIKENKTKKQIIDDYKIEILNHKEQFQREFKGVEGEMAKCREQILEASKKKLENAHMRQQRINRLNHAKEKLQKCENLSVQIQNFLKNFS